MKNPSVIHSLARPGAKSGYIKFIHFQDKKVHTFASVINDMSGNRMSYFDSDPPSVDDPLKWVRSVFRDIRLKAEVIECVGDF